jgi:hypothetical protein
MTNKIFLLWLVPALAAAAPTPSPAPTPLTNFPSDAEIKKLPKEAILATLKHQEQIFEATKAENAELKAAQQETMASVNSALASSSAALNKITDLSSQLGQVVAHDAKMTALANDYGKKLNWYRLHWWGAWIVFALGVIACIVLAILKVTGRLALLGSQVAAKIP